MKLPDNCREIFLEGITDAYVYPREGSQIPVPFSMAQILQINNCKFADALLHIGTTDGAEAIADILSAKTTVSAVGYGTQFALDISATITDGKENVRETQRKIAIEQQDCYAVLKREDGQFYLCYSLPGTFAFNAATTSAQTSEQVSLAISCKSMSDFIPITILSD